MSLTRALHAAWQKKGWFSTLLWPLSWLLQAGIKHKRRRYQRNPELSYQTHLPVIVVGNIYVGGTGKTPVVIALVQALQARGWHPGVISRGYGAKVGSHPRVGQGQLDPACFGDEPSLIAQATQVPIAVHPRRSQALQLLQETYPEVDIIVTDDGLQHLALGRDLEIVVQDARGTGNGRVLPAGPLREPIDRLKDVDVLITNLQPGQVPPAPSSIRARQLTMQLAPVKVEQLSTGMSLHWPAWQARYGQQAMSAVAAIGQPERFFAMLRATGLQLSRTLALPDHDAYATSPFGALPDPVILITGKDAVKCRRFGDPRLWVVHAEPIFSDAEWLDYCHDKASAIAAQKTSMTSQVPADTTQHDQPE